MTGIPEDITEAQARLAAIIESSDDAIVSKTLAGFITSWNPAAEKLFGYTSDEIVGKHIGIIIPKEREDEEFVIIGKVKTGLRIDHFETQRLTKSGELIDLSITVSPIKAPDGRIIGASKIARDIRETKAAQRASAYLAAIVESSDDAIISKDLTGTITSWNMAAYRIFGHTAEEAIGRHITLVIPEHMMDQEYAILAKIKSGQRIDHFETVRKNKNGGLVNVSLTVSPIRDMDGKIVGASKVVRDITLQKATEESLRESNRRKDEFLASISHELRTPMNAIIGLTHLLGISPALPEREKKYVETMRSSADNLLELINNLLDLSRLGAESIELEESEFDLHEMVSKTVDISNVAARAKDLPIKITYAAGINRYYVDDSFRLQQVLTNLMANAVKFTMRGHVELRIGSVPGKDNKTLLDFKVIDTGIGIPKDKQASIFDKFTQVDTSTTRKFGGSGLGLSLAKTQVEKMGGSIGVESREGLGSTFEFRIPLGNSSRAADVPASAAPQSRMHKNVLIVDDYEANTLVAASYLDHLGYSHDSAVNGLEAVRLTQNTQYDVILMDVQMHEMDGFESTRRIRNLEQERGLPRTPIIAMTAHVSEKDKYLCLDAGMTGFIAKPFRPEILKEVLEEVMPAKSDVA